MDGKRALHKDDIAILCTNYKSLEMLQRTRIFSDDLLVLLSFNDRLMIAKTRTSIHSSVRSGEAKHARSSLTETAPNYA